MDSTDSDDDRTPRAEPQNLPAEGTVIADEESTAEGAYDPTPPPPGPPLPPPADDEPDDEPDYTQPDDN